ncbi:MAG: exo-alpha-sialidase [Parachlamydiales bacterium]|nr:exo-alpha-sialidase [Parachlamydiales bacterium]
MKIFKILLFLLISSTAFANGIIKSEFILNNPPFESCHASTLTETKSGKILCSFFAGTEEGHPDVNIWLIENNKNIWSNLREVATSTQPCWNPVLFTFPDGKVFLFYKAGSNPLSWSGFLKISKDEGKTFSDSKIFPAGIYGPIKNKPLLLDNKILLCPSSTESFDAWACYMDITKNKTKTWTKSSPIIDPKNSKGIIQPSLFVSDKGHIKLLARSNKVKRIFMAISKNRGKTFSKAKPTNLPNPNSGIDLVKLKDKTVLLVYNHSEENRYPLNVAISEDDGNSWKTVLTLESEKGDFSYPAVIQTKDGLVHITYTWNRKNIKYVVIDPKKLKNL